VDRLAAARTLSARGARADPSTSLRVGPSLSKVDTSVAFSVAAAAPHDDEAIRTLLRASRFGHDVALSLEREPDSALAASIEGDEHEALVARHHSGRVAGIASRAVRTVYVNGAATRIAYLGQLRIDPRFRTHRGLLAAGFTYVAGRRRHDGARLHLASVVADNGAARRLLARRARGWPAFEPVDTLVSLAIPVGRWRDGRGASAVECRRGTLDRIDDIVACLERTGRRYQFSPVWSRDDLLSPARSRDLRIEDFVLAVRDGRIVGCVACWDQRQFKQAVVRGYSARLARWRPLLNAVGLLTGTPHLPAVGSRLDFAYLSHLALDVDAEQDAAVAGALVRAALADAARRGLRYVVLGLSAAHPVLTALRREFTHRAYESVLYVACWPEDRALAAALDGRPSHPELAIL